MNLSFEQQNALAQFPRLLRALIDEELAAGNSIEEIGHSHPAPPAGAYVKLARKVSTRPRASGGDLDFYERSSSIYSGEFTDAKRFYFVLEPPNPTPPEPDMDAIRKALEPKPDPLLRLAQRRTGSSPEAVVRGPSGDADQALTTTDTLTGRRHLLHFRDKRPPYEIQFALERELMTLFTAALDNGRLHLHARANVTGANYDFELRFVAALPVDNGYSLSAEVSWSDQAASHHDYYRKTSESWFRLWTRDLIPSSPPEANTGLTERYQMLCQAALQAQGQLDSVQALQQAIITGLKRGGRFATSHKEGGTNICWRMDRFIRSDYGDYPALEEYTNEAEFLRMLRQFCQFDVARHAGKEQRSEYETWKLILRRMNSP